MSTKWRRRRNNRRNRTRNQFQRKFWLTVAGAAVLVWPLVLFRGAQGYGLEAAWLSLIVLIPGYRLLVKVIQRKYTISQGAPGERNSREIPADVKALAWRRDGGRCVECGSRDRIEYDHKVPWSKGGSNTANNIQLLCHKCNLKKSDAWPVDFKG
jgi:HNH endonuclease